jgi:hypothetical protein
VIGQREHGDPALGGARGDLIRRLGAVGASRVTVQLEAHRRCIPRVMAESLVALRDRRELVITTRLAGESARDAYRRGRRARKELWRSERDADRLERRERKQLRRPARGALPPGSGS